MPDVTLRLDGLITIDQAAELCGVRPVTVRQWIRRKKVTVVSRESGRVRLNLIDVAKAEQSTRQAARRTVSERPGWILEGDPEADVDRILMACGDRASEVLASEPQREVVYYIQFGDRIKIGTTIDQIGRLDALPHDELLATEPGGRSLERERHEQFAEHGLVGEWFRAVPALMEHIATLNATKF